MATGEEGHSVGKVVRTTLKRIKMGKGKVWTSTAKTGKVLDNTQGKH